jgi:7-cyano-7-deazaguanine synthase in queuosine biosynthesis
MKKVAIPYSGGMDSTLLIALALERGDEVFPLVFDDDSINFHHRRMPAIEKCLQHYSIYDKMQVVRLYHFEPMRRNDTFGFIPGWKMAIQVGAMAYAQHLGCESVLFGYEKTNLVGGYKDELQDNIQKCQDLYNEMYDSDITVACPFFFMEKWEMVEQGAHRKVPYQWTNSCRQIQHLGLVHCGSCVVCHRRKLSFIKAKVPDPTLWWDKTPGSEEIAYGKLETLKQ